MPRSGCTCQNLDDREVKRRLYLGYVSLLVAFVMVLVNRLEARPLWIQVLPIVGFFFGYLGLLQARTRTSVVLALLERDMSDGVLGPVKDRETSWLLKQRSVRLVSLATILALASAAVCWRL